MDWGSFLLGMVVSFILFKMYLELKDKWKSIFHVEEDDHIDIDYLLDNDEMKDFNRKFDEWEKKFLYNKPKTPRTRLSRW